MQAPSATRNGTGHGPAAVTDGLGRVHAQEWGQQLSTQMDREHLGPGSYLGEQPWAQTLPEDRLEVLVVARSRDL